MLIVDGALNMRHLLTGGGMTVALNDVILLSKLLGPETVPSLHGHDAVLNQISRFHWARKQSSSHINILAMAVYAVRC